MIINSFRFDWSGIEFPVSIKTIGRFENQNPHTINVYGYNEDDDEIYPLRISKKQAPEINLLFISNDEKNHYVWIKNIAKLLCRQINKRCSHYKEYKHGEMYANFIRK